MNLKTFDIKNVIKQFELSLVNNSDVSLILYVNAFEELSRLFIIFGKVFQFVESDVSDKRNILKNLYNNYKNDYETIKKMVLYEFFDSSNKRLTKSKEKGSRTLLRLHRSMFFLIKFIEKLRNSSNESIVSDFQNAYKCTLANYHGWFIRKSVDLAAHTLPNRVYLFNSIFGNNDSLTENEIQNYYENFLKILNDIYNRIQKIYEDLDLLDLP